MRFPPPLRMAQRGGPHFEPPTRDGGVRYGGNFLKIGQKGGYPSGVLYVPPNLYLYNFFGEPLQAPKWCFFDPVPILGLKKHHFGALAGTRKKIIEVQDKKRVKRGDPPF